MSAEPMIGGRPIVVLRAQDAPETGPAFLEAQVLPGRGMMLLQAKLRLPSGRVVDALHAPDAAQAARALDGGPDDFAGDASFSFGGAILLPYANRIVGDAIPETREQQTMVDGRPVRLPRNWGPKTNRALYAMHGLILDRAFEIVPGEPDRAVGRRAAGDFGRGWPGSADLQVAWRLSGGRLSLQVEVANTGAEPLPMGIGWHPYFALPSGDRTQARLTLPARRRAEVADYDAVLPTGRLLPTAGSAYDFGAPEGSPLGGMYLDDCFTGLPRRGGEVEARIRDPAAGLALRIASPSPAVKAMQVYAPPEKAFVVVEPQFNLADPFGEQWSAEVDTGMTLIAPGARIVYEAYVEALADRNP